MSKLYFAIPLLVASLCIAQKNVSCNYNDYDTTGQTTILLKEVEFDCGIYSIYSVRCITDSSFFYKFGIGATPIPSLKIKTDDFLKTIYALSCKTFKQSEKKVVPVELKKETIYLEQNKRIEKIAVFDTLVRDSFYNAYIESLFEGDSLVKRSFNDSIYAQ